MPQFLYYSYLNLSLFCGCILICNGKNAHWGKMLLVCFSTRPLTTATSAHPHPVSSISIFALRNRNPIPTTFATPRPLPGVIYFPEMVILEWRALKLSGPAGPAPGKAGKSPRQ